MEITFNQKGSGSPLLLLHGFPMTSAIWEKFAGQLADEFQVLYPDLPGFGRSPVLKSEFSIEEVATAMLDALAPYRKEKLVVIGHSMGGYVALAMVAQQPEWFAGLGLFHSTAYADTPERKESRSKVIEFVERNGAEAFTSNFITPLFADPEHTEITYVRAITMQSDAATVIGYTRAMRDRPDHTDVIRRFGGPVLFLAGGKDQGIPSNTIREQALSAKEPFTHILPDQAHMGMIEDLASTSKIVREFSRRCFSATGLR